MADEFAIRGLEDVVRRMRTLPSKLQKRGLSKAVRKGANVVKKKAVANARRIDDPLTAESIAKNITVQFASRQSKREGGVVMRVGVRGGARQYAGTAENVRKGRAGKTYKTLGDKTNPGGDTWYWRLVEFGTSRTRAQPFLQPAMAESVDQATSVIAQSLNDEINKIVAQGL